MRGVPVAGVVERSTASPTAQMSVALKNFTPNNEFEVLAGGKVVVPGTSYLAGSGVFTDTCVGVVQRHGGVSLPEAVDMAGARPRQLLGLPPPALEPGQPADLVLFEHGPGGEFEVRRTLVAGRAA